MEFPRQSKLKKKKILSKTKIIPIQLNWRKVCLIDATTIFSEVAFMFFPHCIWLNKLRFIHTETKSTLWLQSLEIDLWLNDVCNVLPACLLLLYKV